jgi:nucleoside-diphosphate kinase
MKSYNFLMLKPDALKRELVSVIVNRFIENGFSIEYIDYRIASQGIILQHYQSVIDEKGETFAKMTVDCFSGQSVIVLIVSIEGNEAIALSREMIGVTDPINSSKGTIRNDLGDDSLEVALKENRFVRNLIHSADSADSYEKEVILWLGSDALKRFATGG